MLKTKRKFWSGLLLSLLVTVPVMLSFSGEPVYAVNACKDWFNGSDEFCDNFGSGGDTGGGGTLSFSEYQLEGSISELSGEGLDPSLQAAGGNLKEFVLNIVNFALGFLGLVAVIIVIYGGVLYVTAGGEQERTDKGKKAITYATIGLLIVMGSFAFVNTIISAGGGEGADVVGGGGTTAGDSATRNAQSFNAAASQVAAIAKDIYNGFVFLAESNEEIKSIQNDVQKDSLNPQNFPSKSSIQGFLSTTKSKLERMKVRLQPFSKSEAAINEVIRDIEKDLDTISLLTRSIYVDENFETCNPAAHQCTGTDNFNQYCGADWCINEGFNVQYIDGLGETWTDIYQKYNAVDGALSSIIDPISEDYSTMLSRNLEKLTEIWQFVSIVEAINSGDGSIAYNNMTTRYDEFKVYINNWSLNSDVSEAAIPLVSALQEQLKFQKAIETVEFVSARLSADVVSGRAPLTVIFNVFDTVDPAGGTLDASQITWDLEGEQIIEFLEDVPFSYSDIIGEIDLSNAVECTEITDLDPTTGDEDEQLGYTSQRCTYNYPGIYRAAVRIDSRNEKLYAPGIAVLTIRVNPPATRIGLTVAAGTSTPEIVSQYVGDLLEIDRREVTFTLTEAQAELTFNATGSDPTPEKFKWTFGDGQISEQGPSTGTVNHAYNETGRYAVSLEVTNKANVVDRKNFTLNISTIAARIKALATEPFINQPIVFDGSNSRSDIGSIREYRWQIFECLSTTPPPCTTWSSTPVIEDSGPQLRTFTHEFDVPGYFRTVLQVTNDLGLSDIFGDQPGEFEYQVQSQPPVARFDHAIPDPLQPATVHFDGGRSFDPDGDPALITYNWNISPGVAGTDWNFIDGTSATSKNPVVKFYEAGDYDVALTVTSGGETDETTETIEITDIADIAWSATQVVTGTLNADGIATFSYNLVSDYANASLGQAHDLAYEIDFGDGDTTSGTFGTNGLATASHDYREAGRFTVKVTVYDENDLDKTMIRRFFVGDGLKPVAKARIMLDSTDISEFYDGSTPLEVTRADTLKFDAGDSKNVDGTGRDLRYSWDFGDSENSTLKNASHKYKELSPENPGYYTVKLRVTDKDDATLFDEDTIRIDVIAVPPTFSALQALPDKANPKLITPVLVDLKAFGVEDEDGEVTQYKWWYFDLDDPEEQLGVQLTTAPTARLTIGTDGKEGKKKSYGFGVEISDSDNLVTYSEDFYEDEDDVPQVRVENGPNELPKAKFNVDLTKVFTGEKVTFTSASTDPDGKIKSYVWDFEGDGFYNNAPTDKSIIEFIYTIKNLEGYKAKLKVIDDKGAEAISEPISIYVDSHAEAPAAAFKYEVVPNTDGKRIKFINNSTADAAAGASIIKYVWDFDTNSSFDTADSDGDGNKGNDKDSTQESPEFTFDQYGTYNVKLTITDDQGNVDDVINSVKIPLANPPVAAFTYESQSDGSIKFTNNSTTDTKAGANVFRYIWDFDTASTLTTADSNGDGDKANDTDSSQKEPTYKYAQAGTYQVKLTIIDDQGNVDDVINPVQASALGGTTSGGTTGGTTPASNLKAALTSSPAAQNGIVTLSGTSATVTFDFSLSEGPIAYYIFDKNIYFDTDGNGIKNDDKDFKTSLPGTWKTNFDVSWGKTVVRLTVQDIYGNENSATLEIKFQ